MNGSSQLFSLAAALATTGPHPAGPRAITVASELVRLGDLVDLSALPAKLRPRATNLAIARFRNGAARMTISREVLVARAFVRAPLVGDWLARHAAPTYLVAYRPRLVVAGNAACLQANVDLAAGAVVGTADFSPTACGRRRAAPWFAWSPGSRSVLALGPIAAGDIVPRFAGYATAVALAGDAVELRARSGPVTVARRVRALQSARTGETLLVRADDGEILSVPLAGERAR